MVGGARTGSQGLWIPGGAHFLVLCLGSQERSIRQSVLTFFESRQTEHESVCKACGGKGGGAVLEARGMHSGDPGCPGGWRDQ